MKLATIVIGAICAVSAVVLPRALFNQNVPAFHRWRLIVLVALVCSAILESSLRSDVDDCEAPRVSLHDWGLNVVQGLATLFMLQTAFFYSAERVSFAIGSAGAAVFLIGFAFRAWSIATLGVHFSDSIGLSTPRVQSGPYRWIRHPAEIGGVFVVVGFAVAVGAPVLTVTGAMVSLSSIAVYRIRCEEAAIRSTSGVH